MRPEGLGKLEKINPPHRVSNPRPSGSHRSSLTTTLLRAPWYNVADDSSKCWRPNRTASRPGMREVHYLNGISRPRTSWTHVLQMRPRASTYPNFLSLLRCSSPLQFFNSVSVLWSIPLVPSFFNHFLRLRSVFYISLCLPLFSRSFSHPSWILLHFFHSYSLFYLFCITSIVHSSLPLSSTFSLSLLYAHPVLQNDAFIHAI
jgi:hypothetical protein